MYVQVFSLKFLLDTQGNSPPSYPRVHLNESLSHPESNITLVTTPEQFICYHMPEEEIRYGHATTDAVIQSVHVR